MILFVSSPKSWTQTLYAHLPLFLSSGSPSRLNSGLYARSWRSVERGDGRNCAGSLDRFPNAEKNFLEWKAFELGAYRRSRTCFLEYGKCFEGDAIRFIVGN
jgi:hypothetical protein